MTESDSLNYRPAISASFFRPRWKTAIEWAAALAMAVLWLSAGLWKLSDLSGWQVKLTQMLVPHGISMAGAVFFGVMETFAGILLLAPQWRRWGAWLSVFLLSAFMIYIGVHYRALTGTDCSCFPWLKRAIGPMFFVEDGAMMAVAVLAGAMAGRSRGFGKAGVVLGLVLLLAGASVAMDRVRGQGVAGPESITAGGKQFSLREGRVFLFFFNPYCPHCFQAAQAMSALSWQAAIIAVPTQAMNDAPGFLQSSGLTSALLSPDLEKLKQSFPFQDTPYAVALENGRLLDKVTFFDEPDLGKQLRKAGFVK